MEFTGLKTVLIIILVNNFYIISGVKGFPGVPGVPSFGIKGRAGPSGPPGMPGPKVTQSNRKLLP